MITTTASRNRTESPMYTIAHLSDVHLPLPPSPGVTALLNKRLLGYLSWRLRRSRIHLLEILDTLVEDLRSQAPDHVAVTGDLVNISLPAEFVQAAEWLPGLGSPDRVTVIPGNHDAYIAVPWARSWSLWAPYMASETANGVAIPPTGFDDFPLVRRRGPVAIVGLSSALPTSPGLATGKLGPRQLAALVDRLGGTRAGTSVPHRSHSSPAHRGNHETAKKPGGLRIVPARRRRGRRGTCPAWPRPSFRTWRTARSRGSGAGHRRGVGVRGGIAAPRVSESVPPL